MVDSYLVAHPFPLTFVRAPTTATRMRLSAVRARRGYHQGISRSADL